MPDILVRGLSEETVRRIDEQAAALGLSRNEYVRRTLDDVPVPRRTVTLEDWKRFAEATQDLLDEEVMKQAWR